MGQFILQVDANNRLIVYDSEESFYLTEQICQALDIPFEWYRGAYHRGITSYLTHWIDGIFRSDWDIQRTRQCIATTERLILPIGDLDSFKLLLEITVADYKQSTHSL
jgi:hypothetical protein